MEHGTDPQTRQTDAGQQVAKETVVVDEIIDLEEYARKGDPPPHARRYQIRVDKNKYIVDVPEMTGREILEKAGKVPPENYVLRQVLRGGALEKVELHQVVDFRRPGIEKFKTMLKTAQDGTA